MRQITVFTSNGVGQPVTKEDEPQRQIKIVLKAADKFFNSNGLWPDTETSLREGRTAWVWDLKLAIKLDEELKRLKKLYRITHNP